MQKENVNYVYIVQPTGIVLIEHVLLQVKMVWVGTLSIKCF